MKCEFDKSQLTWLVVDENISELKRAELDKHLATCADCRTELITLQNTWNLTQALPAPEPSFSLQYKFETMLREQKKQLEQEKHDRSNPFGWIKQLWNIQPRYQLAFSTLVLISGLAIGIIVNNQLSKNGQEVKQLSSQVNDMKEMLTLSLLENPSASERMRAVSYVTESNDVNRKIANALLTTLNNDPNVNVRLTTLEVLSNFANDPFVRKGLVASILQQDSPLVQDALADVMVKLQEKKAVKPLQQVLKNKETNEMIKAKIRESLTKLS
jgi:hypothetical protein